MIIIKTNLKKIPSSCKKCSYSSFFPGYKRKICLIKFKECEMERASNRCLQYVKPKWCPIIEMEE